MRPMRWRAVGAVLLATVGGVVAGAGVGRGRGRGGGGVSRGGGRRVSRGGGRGRGGICERDGVGRRDEGGLEGDAADGDERGEAEGPKAEREPQDAPLCQDTARWGTPWRWDEAARAG